jgi:hypothetical protein
MKKVPCFPPFPSFFPNSLNSSFSENLILWGDPFTLLNTSH